MPLTRVLANMFKRGVVSKTTTYTATVLDDVILCSASGGSWTLALPAAATVSGKEFLIKRTDQTLANVVTIDGNASETIDGATTKTLATQHESYRIVSDGSNWTIINHFIDSSWQTFTPTGAFTTNTTYSGRWRRVGSAIDLQIRTTFAGAPNSVTQTFNLPTGLTINTSQLPSTSTEQHFGTTSHLDSGVAGFFGGLAYGTTTTIVPLIVNVAGTFGNSTAITQASPMTIASGDETNIFARGIPITSWEG